jgi:hypothetical protein
VRVSATEPKDDEIQESMNASSAASLMSHLGEIAHGRPVMNEVIETSVGQGRTFVIGCGPDSMRSILSNACAKVQMKVMRGETEEVALHLEAFG